MPTRTAFKVQATTLVAALLIAAPVVADELPPKDFAALVKQGDQARTARKWSDALRAYAGALELRDDPLVAGRIGLVFLEFHEYEAAASRLFHAIERGAGANDAERTRFFQAFLVAKNQTCRLDVIVAQNGVKLELDGEEQFSGRREFWAFVLSGKHKLRASLDGFEDETVEIDAPKGGQLSIRIELRPVKPKEEPAKELDSDTQPKGDDTRRGADEPAAKFVERNHTTPTNPSRKNGSFVLGLGLGFVFEATPTPAIGPNAFIAWRSRSWWEVGVEGRVAWTFVKDELSPTTQFVTWSAMLVPCGRWWKRRLLGCGLLELDGVQRIGTTKGGLLPGAGIRAGLEFETLPSMSLQIFGDVVVHEDGFRWELPNLAISRTGSLISGALSLRALFKP